MGANRLADIAGWLFFALALGAILIAFWNLRP